MIFLKPNSPYCCMVLYIYIYIYIKINSFFCNSYIKCVTKLTDFQKEIKS